jgi:hypothetical protein
MKSIRLRFSGRRFAAVVATVAVAAATVTVSSAQAVGTLGPVTKNLTYRCAFPLVGQQDVAAVVAITFPDSGTTGSRLVNGDLKITATLSANVVSALRAFQTATTEGTAVADVDAAYDSKNLTLGIPGLKIAKQSVPPSGTMPVDISGPTPSMIVYKAGTVALAAGAVFTAKVDTRKADGTPTALGVLNVPCTVKATTPPQDRSLTSIPVTGADVTPPASGTPGTGPIDKTLTYNCVFPESGAVDVTGRITGTIPATGTVNSRVQPNLSITATLPVSVTDSLRSHSAATVSGKGVADADNVYNGTSLSVGIPGPVPSVAVPATGELVTTLSPAVPSVTVGAAGTLAISAGQQLNGTFTPLKADGTPTDLGTFDVPCTLNPGQNPALGTITFS